MDLSLFQYDYPKEFIAQNPLPERDLSRMMVLNRHAKNWEHQTIRNFPNFLKKGDVLVLNDTKVFPARLWGEVRSLKSEVGKRVEILLLEPINGSGVWRCLGKPLKKIHVGKKIDFGSNLFGTITAKTSEYLEIKFESDDVPNKIEKIGLPPLPPYIRRKKLSDYTIEDRERYQSIFARQTGSAAAPTASLHFSEKLLQEIAAIGVEIAYVTLHVSTDTFLPIREQDVTQHKMHGEKFEVPPSTQKIVSQAKRDRRRVIAVGTTAARALESDWDQTTTHLFIYPGYRFKIVDGLLTNFHQPGSTLLLLVSAFAGRDLILQAYREAILQKYRLFSYGDCTLLL